MVVVITGVPYAEPPTGSLRFEKPKPAQSWSGVRDALTVGNVCPQRNSFTGIIFYLGVIKRFMA